MSIKAVVGINTSNEYVVASIEDWNRIDRYEMISKDAFRIAGRLGHIYGYSYEKDSVYPVYKVYDNGDLKCIKNESCIIIICKINLFTFSCMFVDSSGSPSIKAIDVVEIDKLDKTVNIIHNVVENSVYTKLYYEYISSRMAISDSSIDITDYYTGTFRINCDCFNSVDRCIPDVRGLNKCNIVKIGKDVNDVYIQRLKVGRFIRNIYSSEITSQGLEYRSTLEVGLLDISDNICGIESKDIINVVRIDKHGQNISNLYRQKINCIKLVK